MFGNAYGERMSEFKVMKSNKKKLYISLSKINFKVSNSVVKQESFETVFLKRNEVKT